MAVIKQNLRLQHKLERHSESANLRQRYIIFPHCVRHLASPYLECPIWQW